jgi:hypothetical protein
MIEEATRMPKTTTEILLENEHEFETEQLIRIGTDLFYRRQNGGSGGAWEKKSYNRAECRAIGLTEARRIALEWGETPDTVVDALEGEGS